MLDPEMASPRTHSISEHVFIDASPELVWKLYDDPAELVRWAPSLLTAEIEGGGPKRLGAKLRCSMKMAGFKMQTVEEVVAYEAPRKSALRGSSPGMGYDMVLEIVPDGKGTRAYYECVATYRGAMRLLARLMNRMNRDMIKSALASLKAEAERRREPPPRS
jgi:carbon monoxide dehydrogenase subunit G